MTDSDRPTRVVTETDRWPTRVVTDSDRPTRVVTETDRPTRGDRDRLARRGLRGTAGQVSFYRRTVSPKLLVAGWSGGDCRAVPCRAVLCRAVRHSIVVQFTHSLTSLAGRRAVALKTFANFESRRLAREKTVSPSLG